MHSDAHGDVLQLSHYRLQAMEMAYLNRLASYIRHTGHAHGHVTCVTIITVRAMPMACLSLNLSASYIRAMPLDYGPLLIAHGATVSSIINHQVQFHHQHLVLIVIIIACIRSRLGSVIIHCEWQHPALPPRWARASARAARARIWLNKTA